MMNGHVDLSEYLKNSPQVPDEEKLIFQGFLYQQVAVEKGTGFEVNMVLTTQVPEDDRLPLIFDNCVAAVGSEEPENWAWILDKIQSLRGLKNRIFENMLTEKCLNLFQH